MSTIVTEQEMERRRKLRAARVKVADKHNVALGFVGPDLKLLTPNPPQLPKRSKEEK